MIIDSISGFERYIKLHPRFEKVFQYIRKTDLSALNSGEYLIDGRAIYCSVYEGNGKALEKAPLEIHDSYIDIQILLEGEEMMGWRDRSRCNTEEITYNEAEDIAILEDLPEVFFSLNPGQLAIFFPHDAHAPLIGEGQLKKAVIKVLF